MQIDASSGVVADPARATDATPGMERPGAPAAAAPTIAVDPLPALLQRIRQGEEPAMSDFYAATIARLWSVARHFLASKEDIEEIVGDVYLHVWHKHAAYDAGRGTIMAWLTVTTRSRAIDRLRKRRDVELGDEHRERLLDALTDVEFTPEKILARFQRATAAHAAIAGLSPLRQRLIGLAFFAGLSHLEIAQATQLPLGSVKSHLRRALLCLREALPAYA